MDNKYKKIKIHKSIYNQIWTLELANPKKLNTFSPATFDELNHFMVELNKFSSLARVLIIRAQGKHFTAGLDLSSVGRISEAGDEEDDPARKAMKIQEVVKDLQRFTNSLRNCRVPVICAI